MKYSVLTLLGCAAPALAAFGITGSDPVLADTGAGLVVTIDGSNGDITSLKLDDTELQDQSKYTHLSSGLGSATVTSSVDGDVGIVTISTDTITHYYIIRSGENTVYIGTHASAEPEVGELRFIARLNKDSLPNGIAESEVDGGSTVEGSDVFLVDGETRSKFYSSDQVHGVTGSGVGAYIIVPGVGYETSSGGPFFRDIDNQGTSQQEVYFYMNSNHEQTESYRTGFFGPYALAITDGSAPSGDLDTSFFDDLDLEGYVGASGRGSVSGSYSGVADDFEVTIGFSNDDAQYWVSGSGGSFTRDSMKPGTYTATLYQGELEAGTGEVTISAGGTASLDLESSLDLPETIWSIGAVDGTPAGLLNADLIEKMHPSDDRMASWGPVTFTVGSSSDSEFPMAQWQSVNEPTTISWTPSSSADIGERTLRIRTTSAFASGRPSITVNDWSSDTPEAPTKIDSRGVTRGTWRGLNQVYDFVIPEGTLTEGENKIEINIASGSSSDDPYLSPNVVFDSVELI
ncbi:polysaccharide lyase family 4 protein [Cylindrobasidium torrendii FP15055 ss-10]|uniref:rhamnogalacturonan endolyase n=1 Tax=Cylindrobasidium torrendii FP15055 ss-10 TaxID=1314674 RepID=A0A0D7BQ48_9AGAR|nr:polysaccharide lyase family 4 protein [Cylindrobasidium torrendii FP15055 ss-10]